MNKKYNIRYNAIPEQNLRFANQLTVHQWNEIINILRIQTNLSSEYIEKLHLWLIGTNVNSILPETNELKYGNTVIEYDGIIDYIFSYLNLNNTLIADNKADLNKFITDTYNTHVEDFDKHTAEFVDFKTVYNNHVAEFNTHTAEFTKHVEEFRTHVIAYNSLETRVTNTESAIVLKLNKKWDDIPLVNELADEDYFILNSGGKAYKISIKNLKFLLEPEKVETHYKGDFLTYDALVGAHPTASAGNYAFVNTTTDKGDLLVMYIWDADEGKWRETKSDQYVLSSSFVDFQNALLNGNLKIRKVEGAFCYITPDGEFINIAESINNLGQTMMRLNENIENRLTKNFGNLTETNSLNDDDIFVINSNGTAHKITTENLKLIFGSAVGGGGGGGGIDDQIILLSETPFDILATKSDKVVIEYSFARQYYTDYKGSEKIIVDGFAKATRSIEQGDNVADITKYLTGNTHTVEIQVTSGSLRASLIYNIEIIELAINSNFNGFAVYGSSIIYRYTPIGNIEKTIHFVLDGNDITTTVTETGKAMTYQFYDLSHGVHPLEVYSTATVGDDTLKSNVLKYDLVVNNGGTSTLIGCPFDITEAKQGDLLTFNYIVCNPSSLTADVTLSINGEKVSELTVDRSKQTWATRNYPAGDVVFKIESGDASVEFTVAVEENDVKIEAVTTSLELYLTSKGRNNNESATSRNQWSNNGVNATLSNFNWKSNGWVLDKNGDTALRVNGGASVNIPFNVFNKDFRNNGKTIEIEFETHDILDYDSVLISCENGGRGFVLTSTAATFSSEQTTINTKFKEDEKIRLAFVVEPSNENRLVYTYINGIISGLAQYPTDDDFSQVSSVGISIGSADATIDIYNIRIYDINLDYKDVLNNYIADTQDLNVKSDLNSRNDIFDSYGTINYNKVLKQIPCLTIIGELPGSKGDKKNVTIEYVNSFDNTKDFKQSNVSIDVQGTSSQYYPRKNYKFKLNTDYQLTTESIPEKAYTIKADFMESSHAHNTGIAKIVNNVYPTTPAKEINELVQAAITGFPIIVWHKANESAAIECLGVYNFNNDKDDVNTFGYTSAFPYCESWEFKNNTSAHCLFQTDYFADKTEVAKNFEARYPDKYTNYNALERVVSWVYSTKDNISKFKNEFNSYFNLDATLMYYVLTELFAMVDSRAKNLFLTTWDGSIWYPTFYDLDTAFGLNNEGVNDFSYNVEYHDQKGTQNVFNGESSVLWNNFEEAFADEIEEFYNNLRNNKVVTYDSIMAVLYGEQISKIAESSYNFDAIEKYRDPLLETGEDKLFVAQGSRLDHLKWWLSNRLNYMDSKYVASDFKENYMTLRIYTPETYGSVTPNADITVTPYADQYVKVKYDENMFGERGQHDEAITIDAPEQVFNDTPLIVYGASRISDIGDLSPLYAGTIDVAKGVKLKRLIIGNPASDYSNTNLKELTVGNNELLKVLDVRNCPSLTQAIDVSGCTAIEEIYATSTNTTAVKLPNGGAVKKLHLPNSITNLTILNQLFISEFVYNNLSNVSTLHIENSSVDEFAIVQQAKGSLSRVRLTNIDWEINSKELLDYLMTCNGIDESGLNTEKSVLTGKVHINGTITTEDILAYNNYWGTNNLQITATTIVRAYTCRFYNYDGTLMYSTQVAEGAYATYNGETPTKPTDEDNSYTFSGWLPNPLTTPITATTDFTAQFVASKLLVITWLNGDGSVLQINKVGTATSVTYTGATPTKPNDAEYKYYIFTHWVGSDGNAYENTFVANSDMTLTPQFIGTKQTYNVYWMNGDTLLETDVVEYGATAKYNGETPVNSEGYMFIGWSKTPNSNTTESELTVKGETYFYAAFDKPDTITVNIVNTSYPYNLSLQSVTGESEEITIDWGDGEITTYTVSTSATTCKKTNYYSATGIYTIKIPATENYKITDLDACGRIKKINTKYLRFDSRVRGDELEEINVGSVSSIIGITKFPTLMNGSTYSAPSITRIVVPEGVTELSNNCFHGLRNLTSVSLPESLTKMGYGCFTFVTKIENFYIPSSLKTITNDSTSSNYPLPAKVKNFTIGEGNTVIKKEGRFLTYQITPASIKYLLAVEYDETIDNFELPSNVTRFFSGACAETYMKKLIIPENIECIDRGVFSGCTPEEIEINFHPQANAQYTKDALIPNNTSVLKMVLNNNTTASIEYMFFYMRGLQNLTVNGSLNGTSGYAAYGYCGLPNDQIYIPNTITKANSMFVHNTAIENVILPSGVTTMTSTFDSCISLKTVTILSENPPTINNYTFNGCNSLIEIRVPASAVEAYKTATNWSTYADKIVADE